MKQITVTRDSADLGFAWALGDATDYPAAPSVPAYFGWDGIQEGWDDLMDALTAQPFGGTRYAAILFVGGQPTISNTFIFDFDDDAPHTTAF